MPKIKKLTPQQELDDGVKALKECIEEAETALAKFALEHDLELHLGEYGQDARKLLLEDDSYSGKVRGEWLYSSESC